MSRAASIRRGPGAGRSSAGAAIMEFALAWPIVLVLVLGTVQLAVWGAESFAARSAALAGARAGTVTGADPSVASGVALRSLSASLVGVSAGVWCPGGPPPAPPVWVCATETGTQVEVEIGGSVPALVPLVAGAGLPLDAQAVLVKEDFAR